MPRAARSGSRVDFALLALCALLAIFARAMPANLREPVAGGLRRSVLAPLVELQRGAEVRRAAYVTYRDDITVQDSVALRAMSANALESENARLRKLLGLGRQLRWGFVPAEALRIRSQAEPYTLTLTAGANAGIEKFSPVVAPEGLVGMVQTVDPTMSIAIVWAHPDFRVSAMAANDSAFGIVGAHLGDGDEGPERYLLEMRGIPFRSSLKPGTMIVSSGLGGTYPRGIPIGTVLSELRTAEGWARTYLLRPAVLPPNVTSVMVLQPARAEAGVQSIWASAVAADSAARGIVAAGDSVARQEARAATPPTPVAAAESGGTASGPPAAAPVVRERPTPPSPAARPAPPPVARDTGRPRVVPVPLRQPSRDTARPDSARTAPARPDTAPPSAAAPADTSAQLERR